MLFTPKPIAFQIATLWVVICGAALEQKKQKNKNHDSFFFKHELPLIEHEFFMNYGNHIEFDLTM